VRITAAVWLCCSGDNDTEGMAATRYGHIHRSRLFKTSQVTSIPLLQKVYGTFKTSNNFSLNGPIEPNAPESQPFRILVSIGFNKGCISMYALPQCQILQTLKANRASRKSSWIDQSWKSVSSPIVTGNCFFESRPIGHVHERVSVRERVGH